MTSFRLIPSVDELLQREPLRAASAERGRDLVTAAVRDAVAELRARIARGEPDLPGTVDAAAAWLERRGLENLTDASRPSLRRVINATGVVVHTNLGRAPLAAEALAHIAAAAGRFSNLEYDVDEGRRGERHAHVERLVCSLTGAEAAAVTNNNAAAMLVALAAICAGREVVVSRGELVEIGGGFRVPEILAQSGAVLREVGTTNRTRAADYGAAIGPNTAALLRVHPSNFRIEGFAERPALDELASLARRFELPVIEDLGSGWLGVAGADVPALADEPSAASSLRAGADLVAFSGDKLLGGPQAGVLVGRRDLVDRVRRHPLMRAVRADKLAYAALEATLALWFGAVGRERIPVYRMIVMPQAAVAARAAALVRSLDGVPGLASRIVEGTSTIGGGSAPGSALPTALIVAAVDGVSASALDARLRSDDPPVVARIADDRVVIDLRTVFEDEDALVAAALARAARAATNAART